MHAAKRKQPTQRGYAKRRRCESINAMDERTKKHAEKLQRENWSRNKKNPKSQQRMNSMQKSKRSSHFHFLAPHHNAKKQFKKSIRGRNKKRKSSSSGISRPDKTKRDSFKVSHANDFWGCCRLTPAITILTKRPDLFPLFSFLFWKSNIFFVVSFWSFLCSVRSLALGSSSFCFGGKK